jgi:hypothetical protein
VTISGYGTVASDEHGRYHVDLPPGPYTVSLAFPSWAGARPSCQAVDVVVSASGPPAPVDLRCEIQVP